MPGQSKSFKAKYGKGIRSAEDYGIGGLSDETLQVLAGNPGRYGEKSKYASQELAQRRGLLSEADQYRAALERATYQDAANQYGQGLTGITGYLARSGPIADSGAGTALRARLASQIYGAAAGRISGGYADYIRQLTQQRRAYNYQRQLMAYQRRLNKRSPIETALAAAAGIGGSYAGAPRTTNNYSNGSGAIYDPRNPID